MTFDSLVHHDDSDARDGPAQGKNPSKRASAAHEADLAISQVRAALACTPKFCWRMIRLRGLRGGPRMLSFALSLHLKSDARFPLRSSVHGQLFLPPDAARIPADPEQDRRLTHSGGRAWLWVLLLLVVFGVAFGTYKFRIPADAQASAKQGQAGPPSIPVLLASMEKRDAPVYLRGRGSVTAFNTVTVNSRVGGQILQVAFREGQFVRAGVSGLAGQRAVADLGGVGGREHRAGHLV